MTFDLTREEFLAKSGYTEDDWEKSCLDWDQLVSIANHHDASMQTLALYGGAIANRIQAFNSVHSVRWRVKDTYGLVKKILRKNLESPRKEKWEKINVENYRAVVSDLIGVRALHLLKEECVAVDSQIRDTWNVQDTTIFKREGDAKLSQIIERGAIEDNHNAGYRSIHYGITYHPEKEPILVEVQTRTIFQEAWSEIDHKVRYPDFSENELLKYFLITFNGLSATADDMASFVIMLDSLIKTQSASILEGENALAARDVEVAKLQEEIDKLRVDGKTPASSVESLQHSVDRIKDNTALKNDLVSRSLGLDIGIISRYANQMKALGSMAPSPELISALNNFRAQNAAIAGVMKSIKPPSAALIGAVKNYTAPNAEIAAAISGMRNQCVNLSADLEGYSGHDLDSKVSTDNASIINSKIKD
ncbi:RelA/SpoT domain-containing protein [Pseudomonas sp. Irchel 3A7]|uniref:RelA/SpoT domain-containing protein n=1 Tax=Pseudomonas sp. Irchel 3A7 TaxID=2008913 RepID=UPI00148345A6|nr:RelA/SpoT domain-containing protein [Pseudomonas sp. Irchel 3A7]